MPCPQCNAPDAEIEVLDKHEATRPTGTHPGTHYDARCTKCGFSLWRHGHDDQPPPLTWARASQMFCNGCPPRSPL